MSFIGSKMVELVYLLPSFLIEMLLGEFLLALSQLIHLPVAGIAIRNFRFAFAETLLHFPLQIFNQFSQVNPKLINSNSQPVAFQFNSIPFNSIQFTLSNFEAVEPGVNDLA